VVQTRLFRPRASRPADIPILGGATIHGTGPADADGSRLVVLQDGTRVRAERAEVVSE
jgi:hypothetical protein